MTQREKILSVAVGLVVLLWGANWLLGQYQDAIDEAKVRKDSAQKDLDAALLDQARGNRAMKHLQAWRTQSLPRNAEVATTQYRAWLADQLEEARIRFDDVTVSRGMSTGEYFESLSYDVDGQGDLQSVVKFLAAFYQSDQLHKITSLTLTPQAGGKQLRIALTIEAMLLEDADRDSGLNEVAADRLALTDTQAYVDSIVGRNLFAPYIPPPPERPRVVERRDPPPPPPPRPKFDDSEHAYVTGIVQAGPALQAWVNVRTTGEVLRLKAGDPFEIGLLKGTVRDVREKQLVLDVAEQGVLAVDLGDNFRDGVPTELSTGI